MSPLPEKLSQLQAELRELAKQQGIADEAELDVIIFDTIFNDQLKNNFNVSMNDDKPIANWDLLPTSFKEKIWAAYERAQKEIEERKLKRVGV